MRAIARYIRAHHLALLALFVALGGTSMAATNLINGKHIKPHSIPKNRLTNAAIVSPVIAVMAATEMEPTLAPPGSALFGPWLSLAPSIS